MNQLILYIFIFVYLCSFTNEKIDIKSKENPAYNHEIKDFIQNIDNYIDPKKTPVLMYGYNAQYCKVKNSQSCYVSVYYKENWYYFCGTIDNQLYTAVNETVKNDNKEFVEAYKTEVCKDNDPITKFFEEEIGNDNLNKRFKIDCFSQKLRFLSLFTLIYSILLL